MKKLIRLTESDLHNIIKESVKHIIAESDMDGQVKVMAQKALSDAGYEEWGDSSHNPYLLYVKINDVSDIKRIESILMRVLGIDSYYLSVEMKSNMFGKDLRAKISLPGYTHTKFGVKESLVKESYFDNEYKGIKIPPELDYDEWCKKIDNALYSGWSKEGVQIGINDAAEKISKYGNYGHNKL